MHPILFFLFCILMSFQACKPSQKTKQTEKAEVLAEKVKQGINGVVQTVSGNQMPSVDQKRAAPKGFPTTVFFYEPTNISQITRHDHQPLYNTILTKLISTVETDSTGAFTAALPVGTYSVFVQVDKLFFANNFDIRNNISLVSVEVGKLTEIKILVNNNAAY